MTSTTFFFVFIPLLAIILLAVNLIFAPHNPYQEKNSAFECGFHSFLGQNRTQFSISFFIFALLFLLFDLEILLVYPYVVSAYVNGIYGLVIMLIFFLVLTLGFAFELGKNALKIDSRQIISLNYHKTKSLFSLLSSFKHIFVYILNSKIIYKIFTIFLLGYIIRRGYGFIYENEINLFIEYNNIISLIYYFFMATFTVLAEHFKLFESLPSIYRLWKIIFSKECVSKDYMDLTDNQYLDNKKKLGKANNIFAKGSDTDSPIKNISDKGKGRALSSSDSDGENLPNKKLDKGKGRALSLSDSDSESPAKKRKLDKGKILGSYSPPSSSETEGNIIKRILETDHFLEEAEKARDAYAKKINKNKDDGTLWKEFYKAENNVNMLEAKLNKLKELSKGRGDLDNVIENARYKRYVLDREKNGTPASSSNSSRHVSPSNYASGSDFPAYNPADYISDDNLSDNKGESSYKNK